MTSLARRDTQVGPDTRLATELVTQHVRGLIVSGHLRRGQRLPPERELVGTVGVSRTSVRAGLQSLAAKGVVVIRHGAGTFVADGPPMLDSEPLSFLAALHGFTRREMFEARRTLEVGIAGFAADRATDADLAAISDEVTGMFATLEDAQAFLLHDIRFHRAVDTASGNPILASIVEMVSAIFYELRRQTAAQARDRRPAAEMHRRIYQAIRERNRVLAQALMSDHLLGAEREQDSEATTPRGKPAKEPTTERDVFAGRVRRSDAE
jgi:GntR family transcriptional regulator, transcriptional repressor for pyruvate dehydrogenase complex